MGSCVSMHKDTASAVKLRFSIESKNGKVLIPSPVKERTDVVSGGDRVPVVVAPEPQLSPPRFVHAGSKDEAFFDSQPWLDSDCEDDFFSVNGDITPSRGSTPVHHSFQVGNPRTSKARLTVQTTAGPTSPPDKKKRLSELFKESLRGNESPDNETHQNRTCIKIASDESIGLTRRPKSTGGTPYLLRRNSRTSSEGTPNYGWPKKEEHGLRFGWSCLPRLIPSRSFSERRKKDTSPVGEVG